MASYRFVILGGGIVAGYAAKEFAARGLGAGELVIISADNTLPYERPPLSKGFLAGKETAESLAINDPKFYRDQGIAVQLQSRVTGVDTEQRLVRLAGGEPVGYEQLLIATGSQVHRFADFGIDGGDLQNVFHLRTLDDAQQIRAAATHARTAVCVGAGFIAMEVASVLAQLHVKTTMLFPEARVWPKFFTPEMSSFFQRYYADRGVQVVPDQQIARIEGDSQVRAVVTKPGTRFAADLVVGGLGMDSSAKPYEGSGLAIDNGLVVDEYLQTNVAGVFAAGDIANYKDVIFANHRRLEHWDTAVEHAKLAAHNLLGDREAFVHVPYYFSDVFDLSYEYWGDQEGYDAVIQRGEPAGGAFSTWWLKDERVVAAFILNRPDEERELAPRWIQAKQRVSTVLLADETRSMQ